MSGRVETIGDATLYLGDCRDQRVAKEPRRKPWGKTPIKEVVACRACLWTWKPSTGFGHEACPQCGKVRSVRDRNYEGRKNIEAVKAWRAHYDYANLTGHYEDIEDYAPMCRSCHWKYDNKITNITSNRVHHEA